MALEDEYGIEIPSEDLEKIVTVPLSVQKDHRKCIIQR
jgi:acyl carrier protein